jgi:glyoxylase-like metal-dependent hydrolase (beta-lactamase superfamily II)
MGHFKEEGKFNDNSYLLDAEFMKLKGTLSIYVIENDGMRMLIDTGETLAARKVVKKLKAMDLFPIHKIIFTHAHWDHIQALPRILKQMEDQEVELLAHENALKVLKNPEEMNDFFEYIVEPIEKVTPLKENDIINLNGFELKIFELFGHTQDSIGIYDSIHKNIFVGDAILDQIEHNTYYPVLYGPNFDEPSLLKTYEKLQGMKDQLDSISLAHFGVYSGKDFNDFIDSVKKKYLHAKDSLIKWYNENPDENYITEKYQQNIIPDSKVFPVENLGGIHWNIVQHIQTLKAAGFIK